MNGPASWPAPVEVTLLGSTGSIGTQALEVIASHPGHFRVRGLAAGGGHPQLLADQAANIQDNEDEMAAAAEAAAARRETARTTRKSKGGKRR